VLLPCSRPLAWAEIWQWNVESRVATEVKSQKLQMLILGGPWNGLPPLQRPRAARNLDEHPPSDPPFATVTFMYDPCRNGRGNSSSHHPSIPSHPLIVPSSSIELACLGRTCVFCKVGILGSWLPPKRAVADPVAPHLARASGGAGSSHPDFPPPRSSTRPAHTTRKCQSPSMHWPKCAPC
jgi:hypothetical protein